MSQTSDFAYLITSKQGDFLSLNRDSDDRCVMEEISEKYKGTPCNIEYMPFDLAMRKMNSMSSNALSHVQEEEEDEEFFDDEPDYDAVTADEMHSAAWENHVALHR